MTLIFDGHNAGYELERLFRSFFPPLKLETTTSPDSAPSDDFLRAERKEENGRLHFRILYSENGARTELSDSAPLGTNEKECERILMVLLYKVLESVTHQSPEWGILTGIRPVKLISSMTDEEARGKYLVSDGKLALSRRISAVQKPIFASMPENSFSLYVSIPFCPSRCNYCSFVSHSIDMAAKLIPDYLDKLILEMKYTAELSKQLGMKLDTIYFGGGTPTTLSAEQLKTLFDALSAFDLSAVREFTVEAGRPDTITREKLEAIKAAGARRISVNPQTMNDDVLTAIGRKHTVRQTEEAFALAQAVGFGSINADLIAGLNNDTLESFQSSVDRVIALKPQNITVHNLALKRAAELFHSDGEKGAGDVGKMIKYSQQKIMASGFEPYYLYRQKNILENHENIGYALKGCESLYNAYIMEETQTILAVGASATSKLVDENGKISRIHNFKFPYEYIDRFDKLIEKKKEIELFRTGKP